jgi:hypothetical protein
MEMRCALVLTSNAASEDVFWLTGFKSAGFDRCAISFVASRPGRYRKKSNSSAPRWSAIVGIAHAISKPGVLHQAAIAGRWC